MFTIDFLQHIGIKAVPFKCYLCSSCYFIGSFSKSINTIATSSIFSELKWVVMARLFTLPFLYKDQTHTAFVAFTICNGIQTVSIHVTDNQLQSILGSDTITLDAQKGLPIDCPALSPEQDLLVCIMAAIDKHFQVRATTTANQSLWDYSCTWVTSSLMLCPFLFVDFPSCVHKWSGKPCKTY